MGKPIRFSLFADDVGGGAFNRAKVTFGSLKTSDCLPVT